MMHTLSTKNALERLFFANQINHKDLKQACIRYCYVHIDDV